MVYTEYINDICTYIVYTYICTEYINDIQNKRNWEIWLKA